MDFKDYINTMTKKDYVIADPPWRYRDSGYVSSQLNYSLWSDNIEECKFLFDHIETNIFLLWVTNSLIEDVFKAFFNSKSDFVYRTMATWVGMTNHHRVSFGLGNYFRGGTEHLLLFTDKKLKPIRLNISNVFLEEKDKRTRKPRLMEKKIIKTLQEKGYPMGSYIFSGIDIYQFKDFDIECVDIMKIEKKEGFDFSGL